MDGFLLHMWPYLVVSEGGSVKTWLVPPPRQAYVVASYRGLKASGSSLSWETRLV